MVIEKNYIRKKLARNLNYRRRYMALTSNDQVMARKIRRCLIIMLLNDTANEKADKDIDFCIEALLQMYFQSKRNFIKDFQDSEVKIYYTFNSVDDLTHLYQLLKFPNKVIFDNRSTMGGEEVFMRGLYELVSGENQERICMNVFGRECSVQSRAFSYFINHIYCNFKHLLFDNLSWFYKNNLFDESAEAIGIKMQCKDCTNLVFAFIDCNCLPTSVVGGGPNEGVPILYSPIFMF